MNFAGLKYGQVLDKLKQMPRTHYDRPVEVKYDFVHFGPTTLESYRGYYEDAALGYNECGRMLAGRDKQVTTYSYPTVSTLIQHFEETLGHVFSGWKGGNGQPIDRNTSLWVANPGETGDTVITDVKWDEGNGMVILITGLD